jgi:hypothetical protein
MFRSFSLQPVTIHDQPLQFSWDPNTGELGGEGAEQVIALCRAAVKEGQVVSHPHPTTYDIHDPLHRVSEMAVVLGQYWRLEGELQKAHPGYLAT